MIASFVVISIHQNLWGMEVQSHDPFNGFLKKQHVERGLKCNSHASVRSFAITSMLLMHSWRLCSFSRIIIPSGANSTQLLHLAR